MSAMLLSIHRDSRPILSWRHESNYSVERGRRDEVFLELGAICKKNKTGLYICKVGAQVPVCMQMTSRMSLQVPRSAELTEPGTVALPRE